MGVLGIYKSGVWNIYTIYKLNDIRHCDAGAFGRSGKSKPLRLNSNKVM